MNHQVNLTYEDFMVAATKAAVRQLQAIRKDRLANGRDGGSKASRSIGTRLGHSFVGEMAEIALSRFLNKPVTSEFENMVAVDIGGEYEARGTEHKNGHLLLNPKDHDDKPYGLVVVSGLRTQIIGWIMGADGKQEKYWNPKADRPCWYVPQSALHAFEIREKENEGA